ncbi:MAG: polysaccharide pyruvyl transferase family protein [Clostridia bacterium]|nr:polysaccharide pyruvyl transferase family protein [Clostridia bacterium]
MKYGIISFGRNPKQSRDQYGNLGDWYQSFAVERLMKSFLNDDDIRYIARTDISSYRGEKTRLMLQGCFLHLNGAPVFPVSEDIDPCFFGFHCLSLKDRRHIKQLPDDTVIGCRDEPTFRLMQKLGKKAYISGCITATLDRRRESPENGKVFMVDAPEEILRFMPQRLRDRIEYVSQSFMLDPKLSVEETHTALKRKAEETLLRYKTEASLIVTSRLHVASPCTAMGIPVILVRNYFDERYSWIEKYLPLYTPDRFSCIDWDVTAPDIENEKKLIEKTAKAALLKTDDFDALSKQLHEFYLDRQRGNISKPFYVKAYHFMQGTFPKTADFLREKVFSSFTVDTSRKKI